jgi:hypothetical protein
MPCSWLGYINDRSAASIVATNRWVSKINLNISFRAEQAELCSAKTEIFGY